MAFRSRLASASGIQPASLARVTLPASRRSTAPASARRSAADRPGLTPRRIPLGAPDAEIPSGVRMALRIRSISASSMPQSLRSQGCTAIRIIPENDEKFRPPDPQMPLREYPTASFALPKAWLITRSLLPLRRQSGGLSADRYSADTGG
jgi:hypothetical protein